MPHTPSASSPCSTLPPAERCATCRGSGEVQTDSGHPILERVYRCPLCKGAGIVTSNENRALDLAALEQRHLHESLGAVGQRGF